MFIRVIVMVAKLATEVAIDKVSVAVMPRFLGLDGMTISQPGSILRLHALRPTLVTDPFM